MRPLARKALEMIQKQGGRIVNIDRIETTLREIGGEYKPGLIRWIKEQPGQWKTLLKLEGNINQSVFQRDETALTEALSRYRYFFSEIVKAYSQGEQATLFNTLKQGGKTDGERDYSHL